MAFIHTCTLDFFRGMQDILTIENFMKQGRVWKKEKLEVILMNCIQNKLPNMGDG